MRTLSVKQGSPEWHEARRTHHCASDAPAMMGEGKHESRSALIKRIATGIAPEVDAATQRRFDDGHATEAKARPILEAMLGEDLYPVTVVDDDDYLLASLDGLTLDEGMIFEHKRVNADLVAMIQRGQVDDPAYYWQLEHQLAASGATVVHFCVSDGTRENFHACTYTAVPGRREALMRGWQMLDEEVANYVPEAKPEKVVAQAVDKLPAVYIRVDGALTVTSNLAEAPALLKAYIAALPVKPSTDQEFADAEQAIKELKAIEDALAAQETAALASLDSVNQMRQLVAQCDSICSTARLAMTKAVANRKEEIKGEIVAEGIAAIRKHVQGLNARLSGDYMPVVLPDFAGAIKGKRTVDTLREAMKDCLLKAKIAASEKADLIDANLKIIRALPEAHQALCADVQALVQKPTADLESIITGRVAAQKVREEAIAAKAAQDEAERIAKASAPAPVEPALNPIPELQETRKPQSVWSRPNNGERIKVSDISERLGFQVTAEFLASLGWKAEVVKRAHLYREADFDSICAAIQLHIQKIRHNHA